MFTKLLEGFPKVFKTFSQSVYKVFRGLFIRCFQGFYKVFTRPSQVFIMCVLRGFYNAFFVGQRRLEGFYNVVVRILLHLQ